MSTTWIAQKQPNKISDGPIAWRPVDFVLCIAPLYRALLMWTLLSKFFAKYRISSFFIKDLEKKLVFKNLRYYKNSVLFWSKIYFFFFQNVKFPIIIWLYVVFCLKKKLFFLLQQSIERLFIKKKTVPQHGTFCFKFFLSFRKACIHSSRYI